MIYTDIMKRMKYLAIILLGLSISGCAYMGYLKDPFVDIPNFRKINESLYSGGLPKPEGLVRIKKIGIKTIISLRNEIPQYEKSFIQKNNIELIKIPLSIYKRPTDEQILKFLKTTLTKEKQPVFIHCKDGRDRTGAIIAVYRTVVDGLGPKEAYKEAKNHGFWPYRGDDVLKNFIHQLKDKPIYYEKTKIFQKDNQ